MNKTTRNLLFGAVVVAFIILAPLAIFYARGYIIDTKDGKIIKTGIISLDTNLDSVSVSINGELAGDKNNPVVLKNLTPGTYHVQLKRKGFKTWNASLPVVAEKVTRLEKILMIKDSPKIQLPIAGEIGAESVSTNAKYTVFSLSRGEQKGIWLHTTKKEKNRQLIKPKDDFAPRIEDITKFTWSDNSKAILVSTKQKEYYLLFPHVAEPQLKPLKYLKGLSDQNIVMSENEPSTIFFLDKGNLFRWQTSGTDLAPNKVAGRVLEFYLVSPKLFIVQKTRTHERLVSFDIRSPRDGLNEIAPLPEGQSILDLQVSSGRHVAILSQKHDLALLEKDRGRYIWSNLDHNVDSMLWSPDNRYLEFQKNSELWVYDQESLEDEVPIFLVTRLSQRASLIKWHPESNYVLISPELSQNDPQNGAAEYFLLYVSRSAPQTIKLKLEGATNVPQMVGRGDNIFYLTKKDKESAVAIYPLTVSD